MALYMTKATYSAAAFQGMLANPSDREKAARALFAAAGVTNVIADVRYNGGGLVAVAEEFASLLAGPANVGMIQSFTRYNSANVSSNFQTRFTPEPNALTLE